MNLFINTLETVLVIKELVVDVRVCIIRLSSWRSIWNSNWKSEFLGLTWMTLLILWSKFFFTFNKTKLGFNVRMLFFHSYQLLIWRKCHGVAQIQNELHWCTGYHIIFPHILIALFFKLIHFVSSSSLSKATQRRSLRGYIWHAAHLYRLHGL